MSYLNLDPNYFTHPKTRRLVGLLGRGSEVLPLKLWAYCAAYHFKDGKLTDYSAQAIEDCIGWWGKSGEAAKALCKVGLLDEMPGGYLVHDWLEHQGHILMLHEKAKAAANKRWSEHREKCPSNAASSAQAMPDECHQPSNQPTSQSGLPAQSFSRPSNPEPSVNRARGKAAVNGSHGSVAQGACSHRFFREGWEPETEPDFMLLLNEITEDMENFGGRWRLRWREENSKCMRVLKAFREDAKTKIINTPGGYLNDLFEKRLP